MRPVPLNELTTEERQALVLANRGLVGHFIKRCRRDGRESDRDDLEAAGFLALCVAAERFDPHRNILFTTYAYQWIRCKVLEALRDGEIIRTAKARYSPDPATRERAARCRRVLPFDDHAGPLGRRFAVDPPEAPGDEVRTERLERLREAIDGLPPRLALLMRLRHREGLTLQEIGGRMGVNRQRVHQLEAVAKRLLRVDLAEGGAP